MQDYNHIGIIGRLTGDPELESFDTNGKTSKRLRFSVAVNRFKDQDVDYMNVVIWNNVAEALSFLRKGMRVCVDGRLDIDRKKVTVNGQEEQRVYPVIRASNVQCLEKKESPSNSVKEESKEAVVA